MSFGPRPAVVKKFSTELAGAVQAMTVVPKTGGVTGLATGDFRRVTGGKTRAASLLRGHLFVTDAQFGMETAFINLDGDVPPYGAYAVDWHPTLERAAYVTVAAKSGKIVGRLVYTDCNPSSATYGTELWSAWLEDVDAGGGTPGTFPIFVNSVLVTATYVFTCAGPWLFVHRLSDGTYLRRYNLSGWSQELQDLDVRPTDGRLVVAFKGTPIVSGAVTTDTGKGTTPLADIRAAEGNFFRAGLALYTITGVTTVNGDILTQVQFGEKKAAGWGTVEYGVSCYEDHGFFRFSERGASAPRGYIPNGVVCLSTGETAVARTNRGWGPNNTFRPDLSTQKLPVCLISDGTAAATLVAEGDNNSIEEAYAGSFTGSPFYCDIPNQNNTNNTWDDPHCSCDTIAADGDGNVYVAGRRNAGTGANITKLRASDLAIIWQQDLGGWIPQNGLAWDTTTNTLVACGQRNTAWTGASSMPACLWRIDPATGDILATFDLDQGTNSAGVLVNAYGVSVSPGGRVGVVTTVRTETGT